MRLLPYSNIKTQNLGILLFTARFAAIIGYALSALGSILILFNIAFILMPARPVTLEGTTLLVSHSGMGMALGGLIVIGVSLLVFFFSGLCAALVCWEQSLRGNVGKVT